MDIKKSQDNIEVSDSRVYPFCITDHEIIDKYGSYLGVGGVSVYLALVRCRNGITAQCNPSLRWIVDKLGSSRTVVDRALQSLIDCNIIAKIPKYRPDGGQSSNHYVLIDRLNWAPPPCSNRASPPPCSNRASPPALLEQGNKKIKKEKEKEEESEAGAAKKAVHQDPAAELKKSPPSVASLFLISNSFQPSTGFKKSLENKGLSHTTVALEKFVEWHAANNRMFNQSQWEIKYRNFLVKEQEFARSRPTPTSSQTDQKTPKAPKPKREIGPYVVCDVATKLRLSSSWLPSQTAANRYVAEDLPHTVDNLANYLSIAVDRETETLQQWQFEDKYELYIFAVRAKSLGANLSTRVGNTGTQGSSKSIADVIGGLAPTGAGKEFLDD